MIKEALEFLFEKQAKFETTTDQYGREIIGYNGMQRTTHESTMTDDLTLSSLQGIKDYVLNEVDTDYHENKLTLHVVDPTTVVVYNNLNNDYDRVKLVQANAIISRFQMNNWYPSDQFMIQLLSSFVPTSDLDLLVRLIGTMSLEDGVTTDDDGITQKVTAKRGVHLKGSAELPPRVKLSPIRTFIEVDQPISEFVLRVREDKLGGIECALFQADGGFWRIDAMNNIKDYLIKEVLGEARADMLEAGIKILM